MRGFRKRRNERVSQASKICQIQCLGGKLIFWGKKCNVMEGMGKIIFGKKINVMEGTKTGKGGLLS